MEKKRSSLCVYILPWMRSVHVRLADEYIDCDFAKVSRDGEICGHGSEVTVKHIV